MILLKRSRNDSRGPSRIFASRSQCDDCEQIYEHQARAIGWRFLKLGFPGYRLHWRIDGEDGRYICRPDIAFPGRKLAIFVHGCFWHRCPTCNLSLPKSNTDYWSQKFQKNVERDKRKEEALLEFGWSVYTIWECEIEAGASGLLRILTI